jgi:hypothetical protein
MIFSGKLFAALITVAAVGVTGSPVELEERGALPHVYYCDGPHYRDPCTHRSVFLGRDNCYPLVYEDIDSFIPDDNIVCNLAS